MKTRLFFLFFVICLYTFSQDPRSYIKEYSLLAINEMHIYGIPASITLAQGILESGSGGSRLAIEANNHLKSLNEINFPWGVLTNGYKYQHEKMIRSGIVKLAPFYIVSGDFGCHKPCKEVFIEAAKKIELPCEEILFVGDTPETDIIGAKSVGMKTAWIKMGRDYSLPDKPDLEIDHVKELGPILHLF